MTTQVIHSFGYVMSSSVYESHCCLKYINTWLTGYCCSEWLTVSGTTTCSSYH